MHEGQKPATKNCRYGHFFYIILPFSPFAGEMLYEARQFYCALIFMRIPDADMFERARQESAANHIGKSAGVYHRLHASARQTGKGQGALRAAGEAEDH